MTQKAKITQAVLESLGLEANEKRVKQTLPIWWYSTRNKENGALRLTEQGFNCLTQADIKSYRIDFEHPIQPTNQLIIWLDNFMDCPFYLTNREIYVFSEKMAIQLVLFAGDIKQYVSIKARNNQKALDI